MALITLNINSQANYFTLPEVPSNGEACPICFQTEGQMVGHDNMHPFHAECLTRWFLTQISQTGTPVFSLNCPLCTKALTSIRVTPASHYPLSARISQEGQADIQIELGREQESSPANAPVEPREIRMRRILGVAVILIGELYLVMKLQKIIARAHNTIDAKLDTLSAKLTTKIGQIAEKKISAAFFFALNYGWDPLTKHAAKTLTSNAIHVATGFTVSAGLGLLKKLTPRWPSIHSIADQALVATPFVFLLPLQIRSVAQHIYFLGRGTVLVTRAIKVALTT